MKPPSTIRSVIIASALFAIFVWALGSDVRAHKDRCKSGCEFFNADYKMFNDMGTCFCVENQNLIKLDEMIEKAQK